MIKVYIVVPGDTVTGGPELCHQLADALNTSSKRAFILYYPFDHQFETPTRYRRYNTHQASTGDIEPGDIVVLPEVYGNLVTKFPDSTIYFWWLSVGNYFKITAPINLDAAPSANTKRQQLKDIRHHVALHLYQSDYARGWLKSMKIEPTASLSDYLGDGYVDAITQPPTGKRHNIVVYNPHKGLTRTEMVLRELNRMAGPAPSIIPMKALSPAKVRDLLGHAKVYIDFGGHPGKDRIPREAAALGCCVVTNRRGSAGNRVDVPIPDDFKIDDKKPNWDRRAARKIRAILDNYDAHAPRFDAYRQTIAAEPAGFAADVAALFPREEND